MKAVSIKSTDWTAKPAVRNSVIPAVHQLTALGVGYFSVLYHPEHPASPLDFNYLFGIMGVLTVLFIVLPFIWPPYESHPKILALVLVEYICSAALLFLTGAEDSPFLLYSFTPVLTSALFLPRVYTFCVGVLTILSAVTSVFVYPLIYGSSNVISVGQISLYFIAVVLAASLPYVVNLNMRENIRQEERRNERLRLSREIHDGIGQTLAALCWQVQVLRHREANSSLQKSDMERLETLAEQARRDILESLQVLRNVDNQKDDGSLKYLFLDTLEKFKRETGINVYFSSADGWCGLDSRVKLEVSRIFQEILANVRRHSRAKNVWVELKLTGNNMELVVSDDGCGFNTETVSGDIPPAGKHFGIEVMKERAGAIHGDIRILSRPGVGTEIRLIFPCTKSMIKGETYELTH